MQTASKSLASMVNSIPTIFTLDIYSFYRKDQTETHLVTVGRSVGIIALIIAMLCAKPLLGNFDQAFQYIQEFTGFFTPGIVAIFLLGMFWEKTTTHGALAAAIGSAVFSLALKLLWPELPFIDRVGLVFLACIAVAVLISLMQAHKPATVMTHEGIDFSTSAGFNIATVVSCTVLFALYTVWW